MSAVTTTSQKKSGTHNCPIHGEEKCSGWFLKTPLGKLGISTPHVCIQDNSSWKKRHMPGLFAKPSWDEVSK